MEKEIKAALRASIDFLEANGFRYAIIGGIALQYWGAVRNTYDIDFKVIVPDSDYAAVHATLRAAFPKRGRPDLPKNPLIVDVTITNVIVDFLLALPGYEELIIENAVRWNMNGWSAWVCSAEDLIIQKVVARRGKDWLDVEALLIEQRGKLDESYIEDWLAQFAEALERPQMLTEYQSLLTKIKSVG
ncbi:MAG: nucleotidyltransferase [Ardenticatenaceae bacterium]